jgi:hypothetical protein
MKNPLNKRLPREFRKDFGKYLVIFLLLVITIGFVSGFLVADGSMIKAYTEGIDNYNTENGHFRTSEKMNDAQIQSVEGNGIRIYNNFYLEQDLTNGSTMRIFANREQVNLACLMEGEFPKAANEIAIDRMYADNNKISIGDTLKSDTQSWKVTWAKTKGASGYEVYKLTGKTWKKVSDTRSTSFTDKGLKKNTTYQYKIRAYQTVKGKKVYSAFSSVKKIKR